MRAGGSRKILFAGFVLLLVAVACGDGGDDGAGGGPSGPLTFWNEWTIEQGTAFVEEFNKVYPDIQVENARFDTGDLYNRITTQSETGTLEVDVIQIGWDGFSKEFDSKGYLTHYVSPEAEAYPQDLYSAEGAYYTYAAIWTGLCYNEDLVEQEGLPVPTGWEDLADPAWQDELVIQDLLSVGSGGHDVMLETRVYWDDQARWERVWKGFAANNLSIQPGYIEAQQQFVQGNFAALVVCNLDFIQPFIEDGAPLVWVPNSDFLLTVPLTIQIPENAPNPEAAKALVDFMLSEEGQAAIVEAVGQVPARPGVTPPDFAPSVEGIPQHPIFAPPDAERELEENAEYYLDRAREWFNL